MNGYLGEFEVVLADTPFAKYTPTDWAMYWIGTYGQIDGKHHKLWVLDQVARILNGTSVIVKEARWDNGHKEYRLDLGEKTEAYDEWVEMMLDRDEDGEPQYSYDEGCPP
jgi:hypothetical protein